MKNYSFLLLLILWSMPDVWSQSSYDANTKNIVSDKLPKENIYIQTNKDIYKPSEIIWFKTYVLNTITNIPSTKNQTLFVELRQIKDTTVIYQKKFEIVNGISNGDLYLKEDIEEGEYLLIANTASSINHDNFPLTNYKKIKVKKEDSEKALMDYFFDKTSYEIGDKAEIKINFYTNKVVDILNEEVKVNYYISNKKVKSETVFTDDYGTIILNVDGDFVAQNNKITFEFKYNKTKQFFSINIPLKKDDKIKFDIFPEGGNLVYNLTNKVAFKATDLKGIPIDFQGTLFENEEPIIPLKPLHDGMGFFNFEPKPNNTYSIKIKTPETQTIYLPKILEKGYTLHVVKNTSKGLFVNVSENNMQNKNLFLRVQSKGIVYWLSEISLKKGINIFKISKEFLPKGVCELTLLNTDLEPIAERLVFTGIEDELKITNFIGLEDFYRNKDKITLKFKVTDRFGNASNANLGFRVFDNVFLDSNINTNIETHYHLFSNLKGAIYNPSQYFDRSNEKRILQLDLVMLTHGWRNYIYNHNFVESLTTFSNKILNDQVNLNIKEINSDNLLQTPEESFNIQLIYIDKVVDKMVSDKGQLIVPLLTESFVYVKLPESKNYYFKQPNEFNTLEEFIKRKDLKRKKILGLQNRDMDRDFLKKYYLSNDNILDEVVIKTSKSRSAYKDKWGRRFVPEGTGDYVCSQFDIINCANHTKGGYEPENGVSYRRNDGSYVVYFSKKNLYSVSNDYEEATKGFQYIQGYTYKKVFFSPDYDTDSKEFFDNRTTLAWEPNLVTNDEGFAEISFFTSDVNSSFTIHIEGVDSNGNIGSETYKISVR